MAENTMQKRINIFLIFDYLYKTLLVILLININVAFATPMNQFVLSTPSTEPYPWDDGAISLVCHTGLPIAVLKDSDITWLGADRVSMLKSQVSDKFCATEVPCDSPKIWIAETDDNDVPLIPTRTTCKLLEKCLKSQFLGPISGACLNKCPGKYLYTNNTCLPIPPCPKEGCKKSDIGPSCDQTGNPINTATGNKFQIEPDFTWGNGLVFSRTYNGNDKTQQGLGVGWRHNFMSRILFIKNAPPSGGTPDTGPPFAPHPDWLAYYGRPNFTTESNSYYVLERENGKAFSFDINGKPEAISATNPYELIIANGGFIVKNGSSTEKYDESGRLLSIISANGESLTLNYNLQNKLNFVSNSRGQQLSFDYGDSAYLQQIKSNGIAIISYVYDKGQPSKVNYIDNNSRQYLYEDSRNLFSLTGIVDESGQRFASWAYNEQGQAISSEHAGGVDKFTLNFGGDPASGTRWTEETDPLGSVRRYQFKLVAGTWRLQAKDQPGGAGCSAASNNLFYDTNGNITSRTDFNGNKTTYVYDLARNLETSRTEAAGTPLARTVSTEWHATWRLPLKVTEPGRATTFQYDDKANLLNKAITADGQTRRWSWTYADFGQVKTSTDPDGKTSSYQYDAQGNLTALTNAAQQMTQFTRYDANGNPLEILSPDGIKSILTYDARNRLISRQVGAALSGFEYWPTGLLKQATLPSGLVINYLYDAAHRLSEITDNQGHREVYTLNKAGLQEQVDRYDPDSTLANGLLQVQQAQSVKPAK